MKNEEIFPKIDHTVLKAFTTWSDIAKLCDEAIKYGMASVCVPPCYIKKIKDTYGDKINVCTVIGFPLGYNTTDVKVFETKKAIEDGAGEVDMVINICEVKNNNFSYIENEIKQIRLAAKDVILKVIVETCYLTDEEKEKLCKIVSDTKADYIKTSTGFGTGGASLQDIALFKKHISNDVKMKASGGIKTKADMENYINAGCSRIGTSSAISLID
ncbi:deoxyribose-phosphate aldolase [Peptoanaerobacter stomatis]|uniref:Deoxyribose-phosphate aldolase n=1 Tax=Peptoanaerobacter stomatis TaxID=796937 RepID=G9XE08_9FIRM|nr:deoxyribose-phosphate aldolase [Peptoanaerobacter stomatis]EHL18666.1 deoxyribose-phosphate aldolase [Peptoanaerobacter stomatis]